MKRHNCLTKRAGSGAFLMIITQKNKIHIHIQTQKSLNKTRTQKILLQILQEIQITSISDNTDRTMSFKPAIPSHRDNLETMVETSICRFNINN